MDSLKQFFSNLNVKNILKILAIACSVLVFMPCFLVSCGNQTIEFSALDIASGKIQGVKPYPVLYLCVIIPIAIAVILFIKVISDKAKAMIISGAVIGDFILWYNFYSSAKKYLQNYNCAIKTTTTFIINMICLALILVLSVFSITNAMDTDVVGKFAGSKTVRPKGSKGTNTSRTCRFDVYTTKNGKHDKLGTLNPDTLCVVDDNNVVKFVYRYGTLRSMKTGSDYTIDSQGYIYENSQRVGYIQNYSKFKA